MHIQLKTGLFRDQPSDPVTPFVEAVEIPRTAEPLVGDVQLGVARTPIGGSDGKILRTLEFSSTRALKW
ncbi:hypothetical protein PMKS-002492 [Pichia membranifaciens]|uniref:Uncharacterized protein n=1 Tax=Pichia membranifaciens TaxID=4926 RepID=A0A1Q2YI03_9ASCO|nr:hypothetical protein PMKS-002492 [Pichia membranifaciens]